MKKTIGFIGCGKMASAIIKGVLSSHQFIIKGSEINPEFAKSASEKLGIEVFCDNKKLVKESDIIFIATKPNQVLEVVKDLISEITKEKLFVSIAAGVKTSKIESIAQNIRLVRIMPNTPALVNLGMFGICTGKNSSKEDVTIVKSLLDTVGKSIDIDESQIDIVTAISGSGPAFFYQIIEDMARAGEKLGLEYKKSLILAAQTALGSAQMVFNKGQIPVQTLIDNVATKGGCTFVGIEEMKNQNSAKFFANVIEKTAKKASELG